MTTSCAAQQPWHTYMLRLVFKKLFYLLDGWRGLKNRNTNITSNHYFLFICSECLHKQVFNRTVLHTVLFWHCATPLCFTLQSGSPFAWPPLAQPPVTSPAHLLLTCCLTSVVPYDCRAQSVRNGVPAASSLPAAQVPKSLGLAFRFQTVSVHTARSSLSAHDVFTFVCRHTRTSHGRAPLRSRLPAHPRAVSPRPCRTQTLARPPTPGGPAALALAPPAASEPAVTPRPPAAGAGPAARPDSDSAAAGRKREPSALRPGHWPEWGRRGWPGSSSCWRRAPWPAPPTMPSRPSTPSSALCHGHHRRHAATPPLPTRFRHPPSLGSRVWLAGGSLRPGPARPFPPLPAPSLPASPLPSPPCCAAAICAGLWGVFRAAAPRLVHGDKLRAGPGPARGAPPSLSAGTTARECRYSLMETGVGVSAEPWSH